MALEVKKGDVVIKLLSINGIETAATATIAAVCKRRGLASTDTSHVTKPAEIEADGVQTYRLSDGRAVCNYIPGCSSRLIRFEG